jgi:molybdopterin-guanine dinucleotide biosynthesis protein MobB
MSLVISIVGRSNSGKTTLLEKLIVELKRRGYTVAAVKHSGSGFQLDHPGKDSWRLAEAGSDAVLLASSQRLALLQRTTHPPTFEDVIGMLGDKFDFVLVEGFKESDVPKIEVHRSARRQNRESGAWRRGAIRNRTESSQVIRVGFGPG